MKIKMTFLVIGLLLVSAALFAQGGNGAQNGPGTLDFGRGGYVGNMLEPITIEDLKEAAPNAYVIVSGYLVRQRVPGIFVLADEAEDYTISVVVNLSDYNWANLKIDASTPVLVYGVVSKSDLSTVLMGERVEVVAE